MKTILDVKANVGFKVLTLTLLFGLWSLESKGVAKSATVSSNTTWAALSWSPAGAPVAGDDVTLTCNTTANLSGIPLAIPTTGNFLSFTVTGTGTLTLTGSSSNVFTNRLTCNANTTLSSLSFNQTAMTSALSSVAANKTLTIPNLCFVGVGNLGVLTISGTVAINGNATGLLTGANTRVVVANGGSVTYTLTGQACQPASMTVNSGGTLTINGSSGTNTISQFPSPAILMSGTLRIQGNLTSAGGSNAITYSGAGSTLHYNSTTFTAGNNEWPSTNSPTNVTVQLTTPSNTVTMPGSRTISGTLSMSGGKLAINGNTLTCSGPISGGSTTNAFTGSSSSNMVVQGNNIASSTIWFNGTSPGNQLNNFTVNRTGSTPNVTLGNSLVMGTSGILTLTAGTLTLPTSGSLTINGAIANSGTGTVIGNTSTTSGLIIGGTGNTVGTLTFSSSLNIGTLTMNRSSSGVFNLGSALTINGLGAGALALTNGVINSGSNLITVTGATTTAISNSGGSLSYVAGPLARNIPPNTSAATYTWPVGESAYQLFELVGITTNNFAGNAVLRVEAFDGNSGGTANGTLTGLNTDNYWSMNYISSGGTTINTFGNIRLTDNSPVLTSGKAIGRSTTVNGAYSSLGGAVAAPKITSVFEAPMMSIGATNYYVIGSANTTPLCGVYTVGSGGDFASVSDAVVNLNVRDVTCDVYFELLPGYPTGVTETFPITMYQFNSVGGTWKATFRPQSGAGVLTTSGDPGSGFALITLDGADNIILDGRPGGTGTSNNWIIQNTRTTSTVGPAVQLTDGANDNILQYLNIKSSNSQTSSGTVFIYASSTGPGNSGITVQNCSIGPNGTTYPANGICGYGYGTSFLNNDISILNNDIYDFIGSDVCGVLVTGTNLTANQGGNNWTISGNSFYRTVANSLSDGSVVAIDFSPSPSTSGTSTGNTISNNYIGGSQSARAGSAILGTWVTAASTSNSHSFTGIKVQAKDAIISGNVIGGIFNLQGSNQSGFAGVYVPTSPSSGTITVTANTIGSNEALDKLYFGTSSTSLAVGTGSKTLTTQTGLDYQVGDVVRFTSTNLFSSFYCAYMEGAVTAYNSGTGSLTINAVRSLFSGTGTGWNITLASGVQSSGQWAMAGIWSAASGAVEISDNTIGNLSNTHGNSFMAGGIINKGGSSTITGNTIFNLNSQFPWSSLSSSQVTFGTYAGAVGISQQSVLSGAVQTISGNTISNLTSFNSTGTNTIAIEANGVSSSGVVHLMDANLIYGINSLNTSASAQHLGIFTRSGTWQITNNMVDLGLRVNGTSITASAQINGIYDGNPGSSTTGIQKFYHNSVYIGGTGVVAGAIHTYAFRRANTNSSPKDVIDVRNNIFVNDRSRSSGTGLNFGIGLDNNSTVTTDYNDVYGTGTGYSFGQVSTTSYGTKLAWVGANAAFDANSLTVDPQFTDATSGTPDLHIDNTSGPSPVDAVSGAASLITADVDAETRNSFTPVDLGADAFVACAPPTIVLGANPSTCFSAGAQSVNLPYSSTTNSPDVYSISSWSGGGFATVTEQPLPSTPGPGNISIDVPAGVAAGTYNATLMVKNTSTLCTSTIYDISVIVNAAPLAGITNNTGSTELTCAVTSISVTATGGTSYGWSGGATPATANNSLSIADTYTVTVTDANSCSSTASIDITSNTTPPSVGITNNTGSTEINCLVTSISVTATGGSTYAWSGGATPAAANNSFTTAATYTVTVTGANGCTSTASIVITSNTTTPTITLGTNPTVTQGTTSANLPYSATSGGADQYSITWDAVPDAIAEGFNNVSNATLSSTPISITVPATAATNTYTATLTVRNSATGCVSSNYSISVTVIPAVSTYTWIGGNGNWNVASNWSPTGIPNSCAVNVLINSGSPVLNTSSPTDISVGDVSIASGVTLTLTGRNLNVCGNWDGGSSTNSAVVSGNGMVILTGTSAQTVEGKTKFEVLVVNNNSVAGDGDVSLINNADISINQGLHLQSGNVLVNNGSTLRLLSTSGSHAAYIDDFTSGFAGSITGNIAADRFIPVGGRNQHFISSPVSAPALSQIGASGPDGSFITPTPNCDETRSAGAYGTVFIYEDDRTPQGLCKLGNWMIKSQGNMQNAKGYSVYLAGNSIKTLTGVANTGDMSISGLNNKGGAAVPTLQSPLTPIESGWNLVGNPYPSTIHLTASRIPQGFSNQVQVWVTSGPFSGSWVSKVIGAGGAQGDINIAPFQAFMVLKTSAGNNGTYPFYQSERVRQSTTSFYRESMENSLTLELNYNGMKDLTTVQFSSNATDNFDDEFDANKASSSPGKPMLFTYLNSRGYSINTLPSLKAVTIVPMGLRPEVTGTMTISAEGIGSFDPTTYIFLEDKQASAWHNLRNGDYTFTTKATDAQDRFVLHFTPPAQILTTDASCSESGIIHIEQKGAANWNYVVKDQNSATISSGILNEASPVGISVTAGLYTLELSDNNGYSVMKNIQIGGTQPIVAAFTMNTNAAQVNDDINFVAATSAATYTWDFGDGNTSSQANATHQYLHEGVYTVKLTVTNAEGCQSTTTQTITITSRSATGINSPDKTKNINIWSANNTVYIDFSREKNVEAEVEMYNIIGQQIAREKFGRSTIYSKEIPNLEAAYIIVKVSNDNITTTKRVFIGNVK